MVRRAGFVRRSFFPFIPHEVLRFRSRPIFESLGQATDSATVPRCIVAGDRRACGARRQVERFLVDWKLRIRGAEAFPFSRPARFVILN